LDAYGEGTWSNAFRETHAAVEFFVRAIAGSDRTLPIDRGEIAVGEELAVRERLALMGRQREHSHNLKNPLGSIKTILQVQLENPELRVHACRDADDSG